MKRRLGILATSFLMLASVGVYEWNAHFREPPANRLPVPQDLVALDSQAGQRLLAQSAFVEDYRGLTRNFESQFSFRAMAKQNLRTRGDFILVNYQRAVLGEEPMPHISPVAAYDAATDRLLVLDVAAYKYPPVWVPTEMLWRAMDTVADKKSGKTRGFVVARGLLGERQAW